VKQTMQKPEAQRCAERYGPNAVQTIHETEILETGRAGAAGETVRAVLRSIDPYHHPRKGTPLPGGYAILFGDSEDVELVLPPKGEILVGPKRVKIGSAGTLIFGEVQPSQKPNPSLTGSRTPGFFILDSSTGTIEKGLSREDWLKKLRQAGLQGEPGVLYPERRGPRFQ
jgi:hypothetical protein